MAFDFTAAMHALMIDIAATCDELRHVDMARVVVIFSQARHGRLDGVWARIYPLRFPGGARTTRRRGQEWQMPRIMAGEQEALYVVAFLLPRFANLPFEEKVAAVVHEMYHMSPRFDGDLRRFRGARAYHTGSKRRYDAAMARIAKAYLRTTARPDLHAFLRQSFAELKEAHGGMVGLRMRAPHPQRMR